MQILNQHQMRTFLFSVFLASTLFLTAAGASAGAETTTFKVSDDKDFANYREILIAYLKTRHVARSARVCILGEQATDRSKWAWVIWQRGKTMLLWGGGESSMTSSRRILDLTRDVVASEADMHGSTYLVTRAWVNAQQRRCEQFGTQIDIAAKELKNKLSTTAPQR